MSFIFAELVKNDETNEKESILICSDTKATLEGTSNLNWSKQTRNAIQKYGIIKSNIISHDCCISFAGNNTTYAQKLFSQLAEWKCFEFEQAEEYAYKLHIECLDKTDIEFIISYIEDGIPHITCIKDGQIYRNCVNAWIGSQFAFEKMQEIRMNTIKGNENVSHYASSQYFRRAIHECGDSSVGGFCVMVRFFKSDNSFLYVESFQSAVSRPQYVPEGREIRFWDPASAGGYTEHIYPSTSEVRIDIDQCDLTLLYTGRYRLSQYDVDNIYTRYFLLPIPIRTSTNKVLEIS